MSRVYILVYIIECRKEYLDYGVYGRKYCNKEAVEGLAKLFLSVMRSYSPGNISIKLREVREV